MTKPIKAMAGEHPVEAAIREGKIPESRREHYMQLMAKKPKATKRLLAKLEAVLEPPEEMEAVRQYVQEGGGQAQAAPAGSRAPDGPTDYPDGWLRPGEGGGRAGSVVTFEDPAAAYSAVAAELM